MKLPNITTWFKKLFQKKDESIFTVTCMDSEDHPHRSTRCMGFYHTLDEALEAVKENRADIAEAGFFRYLVIEKYLPGVYPMARNEIWFEWKDVTLHDIDLETKFEWVKIPKPKHYATPGNTVNFAIG